MSANLGSERDIAKFFIQSGILLRPDASSMIMTKLLTLTYFDDRRAYLENYLKHLKEWQTLNANIGSGNGVVTLDHETAMKILALLPTSSIEAYL